MVALPNISFQKIFFLDDFSTHEPEPIYILEKYYLYNKFYKKKRENRKRSMKYNQQCERKIKKKNIIM